MAFSRRVTSDMPPSIPTPGPRRDRKTTRWEADCPQRIAISRRADRFVGGQVAPACPPTKGTASVTRGLTEVAQRGLTGREVAAVHQGLVRPGAAVERRGRL